MCEELIKHIFGGAHVGVLALAQLAGLIHLAPQGGEAGSNRAGLMDREEAPKATKAADTGAFSCTQIVCEQHTLH